MSVLLTNNTRAECGTNERKFLHCMRPVGPSGVHVLNDKFCAYIQLKKSK